MLLRHRGMLTLVTLVVLAAVAVGGGVSLYHAQVDPATASRGQLLRYLVLADISVQPQTVQHAWVERLQEELAGDLTSEGGDAAQSLSPKYRDRLLNNIGTLQAAWFQLRTAQYAELPVDEREAFLVNQLSVVGAWAKIATMIEAEPMPLDEATSKFIAKIDGWVQQAPEPQRTAMVTAVKDGTVAWLSTTDLSTQPWEVKRRLAERIARSLGAGAPPAVSSLVTDPQRRAQLTQNIRQLVAAYVYTLADQYAELATAERPQFLDAQLTKVESWGVDRMLAANGSGAGGSKLGSLVALAGQSQQWIEEAPEESRPQVQVFVSALQQRIVWKQLPAWMQR